MVLAFVPWIVALVALIAIHRRARLRGEDPPLVIALATGVVLGWVVGAVGLGIVATVLVPVG